MMWKEIIEKKRWIIMVPIVMVILLLISLESTVYKGLHRVGI